MGKNEQDQVAAVDKKNAVQQVLDIFFIGEYIGLFIGLVPPFLLEAVVKYLAFGDAGGKSNFIFLVLMFVWNLLLYLRFRVLTTAPILPIPLFVIAFLLCIVETFRYFRG